MGDRGSITAVNDQEPEVGQPVLFRHWAGNPLAMEELVERVKIALPAEGPETPYTRREAPAVMALLVKLAVESDGYAAYLGMDEDDGDNSDNGHYVLHLPEMVLEHPPD